MKRFLKVGLFLLVAYAVIYLIILICHWPFYKQFHAVWIVTNPEGLTETLFSGGPPYSFESDAWDMIRERKLSGLIRVYSKQTGLIQKEFSVRDGMLVGTEKIFGENGKVAIYETQYRNGKMHGLYIGRHSNGMLGTLRSYTNDVEEGIGLMFFDDGRLASIYNNKGKHVKIKYSKVWDENGNLVQHAFYDDCMNLTGGVVRVGYKGKGKRVVYDEVKKQKMTVEDFQKTLSDAEKYQPEIWELQKFFSLNPEIIAILDQQSSGHTNRGIGAGRASGP